MTATSVQIKVEEDYDQVMIEEHLNCEGNTSDLTRHASTARLNIHKGQQTDSGRPPTSSPIQTHNTWSSEGQSSNGNSQDRRLHGSVSLTSSMMEEEEESSLDDVTQEYDSQQLYERESSISKDSFGTDQLRTLGEILAYCQVMYGAIQKLDEKFEKLQAKVVNIQPIQLTPELFQKATSKTPSLSKNMDPGSAVNVDLSSGPDPALSMPQLVRVCSPPPPPSVEVKKPPPLSPAPRVSSPPSLAPQDHINPLAKSIVTAHLLKLPSTLSQASDKRMQSESYAAYGATSKTGWLGNKRRNICISQAALQKAEKMSKPGRAARFLMRCVFSTEEMSCSNTLGDATRGLKKLDSNKLSAIREFLARRFPEFDLKEKGKDWRKCMSVMNSTARYLRLMAKRQRLKMQMEGETVEAPDVQQSHTEPIPDPDTDPDPEPEVEQPTEEHSAEINGPIENYPAEMGQPAEQYAAEMGQPTEQYAAEIDVELSDSEEEQHASARKRTQTGDENSLTSCSDIVYEYLGNPQRQVKIPQYAMYTALQRARPELAARVLIKYMFPEDVLVVSNVYGNTENGIKALDYNKISALREHLQERFPWLLLEEDGQEWKVCVGAINSTIRKFRHDLKMGKGRKK